MKISWLERTLDIAQNSINSIYTLINVWLENCSAPTALQPHHVPSKLNRDKEKITPEEKCITRDLECVVYACVCASLRLYTHWKVSNFNALVELIVGMNDNVQLEILLQTVRANESTNFRQVVNKLSALQTCIYNAEIN